MPVYRLDSRLAFPPVHLAEDGVLAVGGDLTPERLLLAYGQGIFPWYGEDLPILWHAPNPRMVLWPEDLVVNRSLRKTIRKQPYTLRMDSAFSQVIRACAQVPRPGQDGTWIVEDMIAAYIRLHELGYAHSIEAWHGATLVGGLYGVSLGAAFFGESMFAHAPDASKIAFAASVAQFAAWGFSLIDCQVHTEHLARFGAVEIPRASYGKALTQALQATTRKGPWAFTLDLAAWATQTGVGSVEER